MIRLSVRVCGAACAVAAVSAARAAIPGPLLDALNIGIGDNDHWACTITHETKDDKGKSFDQSVVRFDPSKPYAEQFTPIQINGHPPSAGDLKKYQKRGETRGKNLERKSEEEQAKPDDKRSEPGEDASVDINGQEGKMDFKTARVIAEDAGAITYQIPLLPIGSHPLPVEKFQLTVVVAKPRHTFASARLKLLAPLRVMVVAKVKTGELEVVWTDLDSRYPPVQTEEKGNLKVSVLLLHFNGTDDTRKTDFKRVKPYSERFGVKIGPLKSLSF